MARVKVEKRPLKRGEIAFHGTVLANESYRSLRHILRFEDSLPVVQFALRKLDSRREPQKANLLRKKVEKLKGTKGE